MLYRALIRNYENSPFSLRYICIRMYIERARAGKAITFRNKRRYGCHNSETVRSVYWINLCDMTKLGSTVTRRRQRQDRKFLTNVVIMIQDLRVCLWRCCKLHDWFNLNRLIKNQSYIYIYMPSWERKSRGESWEKFYKRNQAVILTIF